MKIVEQSWGWMQIPLVRPLEMIERAGRTCYKSESKIDEDSAEKFVRMILKSGHESVIEHVSASVKFITNRGVTHELVRHRLCAYSQESTRYVNYGGEHIQFIVPVWADKTRLGRAVCFYNDDDMTDEMLGEDEEDMPEYIFARSCWNAEEDYNRLMLDCKWRPEQAREVLPNSLKTEIVMTANLREWRHVFKLRTSPKAHPQIRALMLDCLEGFQEMIPILFDDIGE